MEVGFNSYHTKAEQLLSLSLMVARFSVVTTKFLKLNLLFSKFSFKGISIWIIISRSLLMLR